MNLRSPKIQCAAKLAFKSLDIFTELWNLSFDFNEFTNFFKNLNKSDGFLILDFSL